MLVHLHLAILAITISESYDYSLCKVRAEVSETSAPFDAFIKSHTTVKGESVALQ